MEKMKFSDFLNAYSVYQAYVAQADVNQNQVTTPNQPNQVTTPNQPNQVTTPNQVTEPNSTLLTAINNLTALIASMQKPNPFLTSTVPEITVDDVIKKNFLF